MSRKKQVQYKEKQYNLDTLEVNALETASLLGFSSWGSCENILPDHLPDAFRMRRDAIQTLFQGGSTYTT